MKKQSPDPAPDKKNKNEGPKVHKEVLQAFAMLSQLGISMAACIFVGVLLGKYLDVWLGTPPVFLLLGSVVGAAAAFKAMYEFVK